jgi:non-ribosomal peptide synthetase component E (peptide arylation enzyme)
MSTPRAAERDLINRVGEKISCDEVENFIFQLSQVREVSSAFDRFLRARTELS